METGIERHWREDAARRESEARNVRFARYQKLIMDGTIAEVRRLLDEFDPPYTTNGWAQRQAMAQQNVGMSSGFLEGLGTAAAGSISWGRKCA